MKIRKILSLVLAILLALSSLAAYSSCKKAQPVKQKRTHVFSAEEIPLPIEVNYIQSLSAAGGKAYAYYQAGFYVTYDADGNEIKRVKESEFNWDEEEGPVLYASDATASVEEETEYTDEPTGWTDYVYETYLTTVDLTTKECVTVKIDSGDLLNDGYLQNGLRIGSDGRLYGLQTRWTWDEETQDSTQSSSLITIDPATGKMQAEAELDDDLRRKAGMNEGDYFYINNFALGNGVIYLQTEKDILVLGLDGSFKSKLNLGITSAEYWLNGLFPAGDKLTLNYYADGKQRFMTIENGTASEFTVQTGEDMSMDAMSLVAADAGHVYFNSSTGIYAYDMSTGSFGELLNYINSDIDTMDMRDFIFLEDGRLLSTSSGDGGIVYRKIAAGVSGGTSLMIYTPVPDEQLNEEIILNVGMIYADYSLRRAMIRFNKQNTGVRLAIRDYSIYNNDENEWTGAVTKFNNDIVTGSMPDIVLLTSEMPVESYFSKKVFVDLNKFIDDPEKGIDRSTLVTNILDANTTDGKLYSMIYSYSVSTLLAKSEIVGTKEGWTFEDMMAAIKKLPEGARAFFDYTRDSIVEEFFRYSMNSFIDWKAGKSYFDTPGFIEFANYLKTCPEKGFWEELYGENYEYDPDLERQYEEQYQLRFARNMALFQMLTVYDPTAYQNACNTFLTKDITAIGYPRQGEGNGAVIVPNVELAISSKTAAKDEAWEALKFFLGPDGLTGDWGLTINKAAFDEKFAGAKESYGDWSGYTEQDREWMKESGYSDEYIDYMMMSRSPYDPELTEACRRIVLNANVVARTDSALVDIVKEDLSAVFSGQKAAADVVKQIASRVDLYVAEHK